MAKRINFTELERNILIEISKRQPVIYSKSKDYETMKAKEVAWDVILAEYNSDARVSKRDTLAAIKVCWLNLLNKAKKEDSLNKKELNKTGGGIKENIVSQTSETIIQLMPQTFNSLVVEDIVTILVSLNLILCVYKLSH